MIKTQHFKSAKKALLLSMAATGLLSLANTASATGLCKPFEPWVEGKGYNSGQKVTYSNIDYQALTAHTAYVGANWNPAASPTLWKSLGTCSNWEVVQRPTPTPPATPSLTPTVSPTATPTATVTPTATAAITPISSIGTWSNTAVYTAGQRVSYNGRAYEAKWWVQGHAPNAADQWGPWKDLVVVVITPTPTMVTTGKPTPTPCPGAPKPTWPAKEGHTWQYVIKEGDATTCTTSIWVEVPITITPTPTPTTTAKPTPCLGAPKPTWPAKTGHTWVYFGSKPGSTSCGTDYWAEVPDITTTPTPSPSPTPTATPTPIDSNYVTSVKTTTWKNGAKGAYSLVHDDYCSMPAGTDPYIKIMDPELSKRGLVAGFGIITGSCSPQHWAAAKQMIANGHEIVSHSRSHPNPYINDAELEVQLNGAAADIASNLDGYKASYFVWPGDAASTAGTTFLKDNTQYLGGRASHLVANGNVDYTTMPAGINAANFDNPFRIKWDLFTADGKWSLYPMGSEILNLHIDAAINQGGWATRTMHGVDTGYWETAPLARYQGHLDYAKAKVDAGDLWMDTPSNIIKYRHAREFCISVLDNDGPHSAVLFKNWSPECKQYATPVTLEFTTQTVKAEQIIITQDEKALTLRAKGNNTYLVTVNPLGGMVKFKQQP